MKLSTVLAAILFIGSAAAAPTPNDEWVTRSPELTIESITRSGVSSTLPSVRASVTPISKLACLETSADKQQRIHEVVPQTSQHLPGIEGAV